ncbi:MAG: D-aminoacyl-tRNA deacylase [Planctomycetota bacterium]|nr:D-aminoacyl-tRNA deacylase [Planctomycetota bacterium]
MIACVQRVSEAWVRVGGEEIARIGKGMLILLGIEKGDGEAEAKWMASKLAGIRIFEDAEGKMNLDIGQAGGEALVVSQFTLAGDCSRGRRPGFERAAPPDEAERLYGMFCDMLRAGGIRVGTGRFAAKMQVGLINEGPVTFVIERRPGAGA